MTFLLFYWPPGTFKGEFIKGTWNGLEKFYFEGACQNPSRARNISDYA